MTDLEDDLKLALELADIADRVTMARHGAHDLVIETKPDATPVTESDKAAELAIRERLAVARPDDAVIGEEFGSQESGATREWIIDPIDGTKSYLRAMPTWTTLIALRIDGEIAIGVVAMPALGKRWWALRGGGAFADGKQIHVSTVTELEHAHMGWSGIEDWDAIGRSDQLLKLARSVWRTRGVGDAWQYMLLAEGVLDIATDPEATLWDLAAPSIVVEEAGGHFTGWDGKPGPASGSGLATNGPLHASVQAILGSGS